MKTEYTTLDSKLEQKHKFHRTLRDYSRRKLLRRQRFGRLHTGERNSLSHRGHNARIQQSIFRCRKRLRIPIQKKDRVFPREFVNSHFWRQKFQLWNATPSKKITMLQRFIPAATPCSKVFSMSISSSVFFCSLVVFQFFRIFN